MAKGRVCALIVRVNLATSRQRAHLITLSHWDGNAMQLLIDPTTLVTDIGDDWVTPTKLRPLFQDDPSVVWLEIHGAAFGFYPTQSEYGLTKILEPKGRQFEAAWMAQVAPEAQQVCGHAGEGRMAERVQETIQLMTQRAPVIGQPALWWPQEQLYGVPDVIALASWVQDRLPILADCVAVEHDHYVVLDLKFTSGLEKKTDDRLYYKSQVRLYSYMLGHIQRLMPRYAFIVTRDRLFNPLVVTLASVIDSALDHDLAERRERYYRIARAGESQRPWEHADIAPNYGRSDERWSAAKAAMMARVPGGAVERMWYIGQEARRKLHAAGIMSLDMLLAADPSGLPKGVLKQPKAMLAILEANREGRCLRAPEAAPPAHRVQLFVDCEFFSNINVDFEREWPDLRGTPMIFMIGVGWMEAGIWHYQDFIATAETHSAELTMLNAFNQFVAEITNGDHIDCALYHWSHAERTQMQAAADRHALATDHTLRVLPWDDLEQRCRQHACAVPGAWSYSLKSIGKALTAIDASYDPEWPLDLGDGSTAQVMGWYAYQCPDPIESYEMRQLRTYLAADCRATYQVLRWLRG